MTDRTKRRLEQIEDAIAQKEDASETEFHIQFVRADRTIASTLILRANGERETIPGSPEVERTED